MAYKRPYKCQIPTLPIIYEETFGYITDGTFVDVGAYDGYQWSNTYELAVLGWAGVCIEPHPAYYAKCLWHYLDNPKMEVLNCAVSDFTGEAELRLAGSLSTISTDMVKTYQQTKGFHTFYAEKDEYHTVKVDTLDNILQRLNIEPQFQVLSIDVEGSEMAVLNGFSLRHWWPHLAIVETYARSDEKALAHIHEPIDEYFTGAGYRIVYEDHINSIYRRTYDPL